MNKKLAVIIMFILLLTGCTSKEARQVVQQIDSIGEITLDSFNLLQSVSQAYNQLNDKDKSSVKNVDILNDSNKKYFEMYYADLNNRIAFACESVTSDSLKELQDLLDEYSNLSDDGKKAITNFSVLSEGISDCEKLVADEKVQLILDKANGNTSAAMDCLKEYSYILSEDQVSKCLIQIGRFGSRYRAEKLLKSNLKDPNSLTIYSLKVSGAELQNDGSYMVKLTMDYGASNSFGAMVRDDVEINVFYEVDIASETIRYTNANYTPYYAWKMVSVG